MAISVISTKKIPFIDIYRMYNPIEITSYNWYINGHNCGIDHQTVVSPKTGLGTAQKKGWMLMDYDAELRHQNAHGS